MASCAPSRSKVQDRAMGPRIIDECIRCVILVMSPKEMKIFKIDDVYAPVSHLSHMKVAKGN